MKRFIESGSTPKLQTHLVSGTRNGKRPLLLIALPVLLLTLWLAVRQPDPVIAEDYYRQGLEINKTLAAQGEKGLAPAMQGRNHAATPAEDAVGR